MGFMPPADKYFLEFLAGKLNQRLLPDLQKLSVTFAIVLNAQAGGPAGDAWTLTIANGVLVSVARGALQPQCSFRLDTSTFLEIAAGRLSPQFAFFQRRIDIEGQIETGLRLATVLAGFFKQFPFDPGASAT
jgi:putative sterol carrier protein